MRILFAEDDRKLGKHIKEALIAENFAIDYSTDGEEALWLAENYSYDIIILDIMLPHRDGVSIIRSIRRQGNTTPVILVTVKSDIEDKVKGLDAGADDYLVKPFSVIELLARIRALLRRQRPTMSNILKVEDLEMDLLNRSVKRGDKTIELTSKEFSILELLMISSPKPVSKATIIERVWNQFFDSETNIVNVYINHLRKKIDLKNHKPLLQTIRGVGFALKSE
ncbi:MAG: response regulator transcription factor [Ignavibacteria bacterium]|nr:response regulator transcription factor [Ignavibacteria bacterium]